MSEKSKIKKTVDPADSVKSDFITIASHMFRTPMSAVRWSLDMLLSDKFGKLNDKQREIVAEAYRHNQFLVKVVNTLLKVSRIEGRGVRILPEAIDVVELLQDLINEQAPFAAALNCKIELKVKNKKKTIVYIDPTHMRTVLGSLLDNAVRYSKDGKGAVIVEVAPDGEGFLACSITDNGIGIPVDQQQQMFTKFFRAKNAMRSQTEGLGLDLYIAKKVIEASGGAINFQSDAKNTTFTVLLPTDKKIVLSAQKNSHYGNETDDQLAREREFVNITVHELKAPLGMAKWSLEMLESQRPGPLTTDQEELVGQLYRGNERLLVLVRDLLNLAKLQEGKFAISPALISLESIIDDIVTGFSAEAKKRDIALQWKSPKTLPKVQADSARVGQVVTNLISNAVKYTPDGGKVMIEVKKQTGAELRKLTTKSETIAIEHTSNASGYLVVSVKDTGIGISKQDQERLFTRFFRSKNVLQSKKEGTGLGLYITKSIVNLHQGDIWFTSKLKEGSTFYFSLPIASTRHVKNKNSSHRG